MASTVMTPADALLRALLLGPSFGLELRERVKQASGGSVNLGQGTLYPTLRNLERDGLVTSWERDPLPERCGWPRRYYELTAEGLRVAREEGRFDWIAGVLPEAL